MKRYTPLMYLIYNMGIIFVSRTKIRYTNINTQRRCSDEEIHPVVVVVSNTENSYTQVTLRAGYTI